MPAILARLEQFIAESEQRITEQVFRIMAGEARGQDASQLRRSLMAFEGILIELWKTRESTIKAERLVGRVSGS